MTKFARFISTTLACSVLAIGLTACSKEEKKTPAPATENTGSVTQAQAAEEDGEDLGFTEVEIFSGVEKEFLNLNAVYFQPVDMTGGYKAEDYDCHLELDVSALENGLGYGKGDWVPYLTVEYEVSKNGGDYKTSGTFMPMAASDGPHYGANIKVDGDGLYTVTFTVKFPDSSTYLIHTDETGPDTHAFPNAIVYTYDKWQFTKGAWAE